MFHEGVIKTKNKNFHYATLYVWLKETTKPPLEGPSKFHTKAV